jgi:CheY-like chemotaxis protein
MKFLQHTSARTTLNAPDRTLVRPRSVTVRSLPRRAASGRAARTSRKTPRMSAVRAIITAFGRGGTRFAWVDADHNNVSTRRPLMHSILLVDDEPEILAAWRLILENEGYEVQCASNGVEAVKCVIADVPDLIITDLMMPLMDGAELCRHLKTTPATANVPILLHTAVPPVSLGACDWSVCLRKPVGAELFLKTVEELCALPGSSAD